MTIEQAKAIFADKAAGKGLSVEDVAVDTIRNWERLQDTEKTGIVALATLTVLSDNQLDMSQEHALVICDHMNVIESIIWAFDS